MFSLGSGVGQALYQDTAGLIYTPSTNTLYTTNFVGTLTGNASSATKVQVDVLVSGANYVLLGSVGAGVGQTPMTYSTLIYTTSTNTLATNVNGTAGTVSTAAQPNITSVGTLSSLTSSGNISGANIISSTFTIHGVTTGISAAGNVQGNATALTKEINTVSTVLSGQGVILPTAVAGMIVYITNSSANSLIVYPAANAAINALAANAGITMGTSATLQFIAPTTTQWYTVGATYA